MCIGSVWPSCVYVRLTLQKLKSVIFSVSCPIQYPGPGNEVEYPDTSSACRGWKFRPLKLGAAILSTEHAIFPGTTLLSLVIVDAQTLKGK